ncbi:uncharacterized protein LOC123263462 [Cotesia glomerata]|uniref:Uncharacterized protein n=1 Tax=Cotesia glomerata TaxID=32391 RepID=A0AAV7IMS2_COTGL|nr:uncharacterized protein LOC123263462 [Cotesia glomerata]XP_044582179.1 uncharacterized protein LOC123263462 [Cotesia glomerata]KAH0553851.1 hypothetical protein KQX54_005156 [Cotesia glomerata]
MTTRADFFGQRPRRRSSLRQALAVIPDMTSLSVSLGSPPVASPNNNLNTDRSPWHSASIATSSPDELVIQKRGRRSKTIIWSPEADSKRNSLLSYSAREHTPEKNSDSQSQSPIMMREHLSIKKRLDLSGEFNESHLTTPDKKYKLMNGDCQFNGNNLLNGLRGLSNEQLVKMIMNLVTMQEEGTLSSDTKLRDVILNIIPAADVSPLQERLGVLRQNIFSSLISAGDSAYIRAYVHLDAFQKTLMEQGMKLLQSQHWISLMHYVFIAWAITKDLPEWNNGDNTSQKCFSSLANFCKQALLNGNFDRSVLETFSKKIQSSIHDHEDMKICLQMAHEMMR